MSLPLNPVCTKYYGLINTRIASGQGTASLQESSLKTSLITAESKQFLSVPENMPLTLYDIVKPSLEILPRLRFIYLTSIIEAFAKEYFSFQENIRQDEVKEFLAPNSSLWKTRQTGLIASDSLLNTAFLRFCLEKLYSLDFSSISYPTFWEAGPLRNAIIHHDGILKKLDFTISLEQTTSFLSVPNEIDQSVEVTDKLLWTFIEGSRTFLRICDNQMKKSQDGI